MRSLATLGGVLVLIVLAIAWRISNKVDASNDPDPNSGIVTLGTEGEASGEEKTSGGLKSGLPYSGSDSTLDKEEAGPETEKLPGNGPATILADPPKDNQNTEKQPGSGTEIPVDPNPASDPNRDTPPPKDSPKPMVLSYTVKDGDTLYRILTNAYGSATPDLIEAIASANELDDPGAISPGDVLKLPEVEGYSKPKLP